jgi:SAM-dependent methyltransferase
MMHDYDDEQAKLWNGVGGCAWVDTQDVLERVFKPFEELLLDVVPRTPRAGVLDVGCGTGSTTFAIARVLGPGSRSVGIDISGPMISAARARAEREAIEATFIIGNAQTHPFEPASFDAIVSRFGVMFFSDPVGAFTNLRRAATASARLRFIAWRSPAENPFMTTAERAAAPLLPDLPPRRPDAPGQFAFANGDRVRTMLEESGWRAIEMQPADIACSFPEAELVRYFTRLGPVGSTLQGADERTRARVVDTVRPAFDPFVHGDEVRFTAACWTVDARP